jgi:hypothetical protein
VQSVLKKWWYDINKKNHQKKKESEVIEVKKQNMLNQHQSR